MASESFGDSTELERFVTKGGFPARTQEEGGGVSVFGEGADGPASYIFKCGAANGVAGPGTPGNSVGVFGRFHNVNEGVEGLAKRVIFWDIIKQLHPIRNYESWEMCQNIPEVGKREPSWVR